MDSASLTQQMHQVAAWAQQLEQMAQHYKQLEAQVKTTTGNKNIAGLLNNSTIKSVIPENWSEQYSKIKTVEEAQAAVIFRRRLHQFIG